MKGKKLYFDYLLIAGGKTPSSPFIRKIRARSGALVTVDRGVTIARKLSLRPFLHVGDGDSCTAEMVLKAAPHSTIELPRRKSISDLEFAIQQLPENSTKIILGAHRDHEGRTDHL